jgi:hypothetical protein
MGMQLMRFRPLLVLGLIGLVAGFSTAQEVVLKLRYQPGQTLNYKVTVEGKVNLVSEVGVATDLQFKGDLTQEQVVKEVADDGTATLLLTVSGKMKLVSPTEGTQPTEQEVPTTKVMMKIAPDGRNHGSQTCQGKRAKVGRATQSAARPVPSTHHERKRLEFARP